MVSVADQQKAQEVLRDLHPVDQWIARVVRDCHQHCVSQCQPRHDKIKEYYDQYDGGEKAPRGRSYTGLADVYPSLTREAVDVLWGVFMTMLYPGGSTEFFDNEAVDMESAAQADVVKKTLRHYLRAMDVVSVDALTIKDMLIGGLAPQMFGWEYEVRPAEAPTEELAKRRRRLQRVIGEAPEREYRKRQTVIRDQPFVEGIDVTDFYIPDQAIKDLDEADYCGYLFYRTLRALTLDRIRDIEDPQTGEVARIGMYENLDAITPGGAEPKPDKSIVGEVDVGPALTELPLSQMVKLVTYWFSDFSAIFDTEKAEGNWQAHLRDFWGWDDEDMEAGGLVTLANDLVPIRVEPMDDPSGKLSSVFTLWGFVERKGSIFAKGIPEIVRDDQIELTAMHNQGLDIVTRILNGRTFVDSKLGLPAHIFQVSKPNAVHVAPNPDQRPLSELIYKEQFHGLPADFYRHLSIRQDEAKRATGATDTVAGMPTKTKTSATEYSGLTQNSHMRLEALGRKLEAGPRAKSLDNIYGLVRRKMTTALVIHVLGEAGLDYPETVTPEEIWGEFRFRPMGLKETANRFIRSQQVLQLLDRDAAVASLDVAGILEDWFVAVGLPESRKRVRNPNRPYRMRPIPDQWKVFLQGHKVAVTGQETIEEHGEALQAHDAFLDFVVPDLAEAVGATEGQVNRIVNAVEANIHAHEYFVARWREEQELKQMMAAQGGQKGLAPSPGPENEAQVMAATGPGMPGALPNAEGMR